MGFLRNERIIIASAVFIAIAIAAIAGFFHSSPKVQRWCANTCEAAFNCDLDFSDGVPRELGRSCFVHQNQCNNWCGYEEPQDKRVWKVVVGAGPWGAFAYDAKAGAWGLSDSAVDPEIARYSAYIFCNRYSDHCVVMDTFRDICVGVASGPKNTLTWDKDKDQATAIQKAITKCNQQSKTNDCVFRHGTCYPDKTGKRQKEN